MGLQLLCCDRISYFSYVHKGRRDKCDKARKSVVSKQISLKTYAVFIINNRSIFFSVLTSDLVRLNARFNVNLLVICLIAVRS